MSSANVRWLCLARAAPVVSAWVAVLLTALSLGLFQVVVRVL
jgi:hypothetical protein